MSAERKAATAANTSELSTMLITAVSLNKHAHSKKITVVSVNKHGHGSKVGQVECEVQGSSWGAPTDLSRRVPKSFWKRVPDSSSLNSASGRFRSSWKKKCASWNRARSTASLPTCRAHHRLGLMFETFIG